MALPYNRASSHMILKPHHTRQSYELDTTGFHCSLWTKLKYGTITLAFGLVTLCLFPTHRFVMMLICAKLFSNPTMHDKIMGLAWTSFTEAYVTLAFDLATWILFETHCFVMIFICAICFSNPTDKVMGWIKTGVTEACRTKLGAGHDFGTHKRTHNTHKQTHTHG